jgi:hypothetical protein
MIHIPIEQRYDKSRQMFHTGAWIAAGTIISVGAAAAGTAMSTSAANKAAKATGAAGSKMDKRMREAQKRLVAQLGQIQEPQWNIARDIKDAGQVTDFNVNQLEKIFPGAKTSRDIAAQTAISYQKGEIPQDVRDSIMRSVAELGGAGFAPQQAGRVGGFQAAQGLLSRQLGLQSIELSQLGNQISQSWQAIAGSFIESPLQVGQARLGYEKAAADIQLAKAQAEAGMAVNVAKGAYGTAVDTIGARLAAGQALASGISSTGQALGGGISSYGMATSAARGAGTIDYKGQDYGSVKGYGGQTYSPAVSQSGGLYYKAQPSVSPSASRALTGAYG